MSLSFQRALTPKDSSRDRPSILGPSPHPYPVLFRRAKKNKICLLALPQTWGFGSCLGSCDDEASSHMQRNMKEFVCLRWPKNGGSSSFLGLCGKLQAMQNLDPPYLGHHLTPYLVFFHIQGIMKTHVCLHWPKMGDRSVAGVAWTSLSACVDSY